MKTMTCKQLGGVCDQAFTALSFEDMAQQSKAHAMDMFAQSDQAHLDAMEAMKSIMAKEGGMQEWFDAKRAEFDALPED